ncbi:GAP family protein [Nocardioides sp. cx-173]|uniref:GAP family protein n=1 Tax=Nocardioides sp. cx-173 TaxID=2898796 RepID=UPI001E29EA8D|nr:GAP family protein [Nocardioides sp. cx-173]MCD4525223.1 GAP family protein [Nocardioides sp. cx-173]UGB40974.1 GAP family protein [Nocardioides sp. cx-173]
MLSVLALVVPLAFAGAVSPVMLTEQTVLLAGRDGRRVAGCYAIGVGGTSLAILSVLVLFGRSIALPEEPSLSASLDIALGSLLLLVAAVLRYRRPRTPKPSKSRAYGLSPVQALGFGVFSMATNFTTLAVMVPAAKEIAASDLTVPARLVLTCIVAVVTALPAWLPIAMTLVAPDPTHRALQSLADFIEARGRWVTVLLLVAVGLFLVVRGIVRVFGG